MPFKKGNQLGKGNKGKIRSEKTRKKIGDNNKKRYATGEKFGFQKGHKFYPGGEKGWFTTGRLKGNKNHNWIDGRSLVKCRYPAQFRRLRNKILERDNFTCQKGGNCSGQIGVHHIDYDKNNNKENNLITLCSKHNTKANKKRDYWKRFYEKIIHEKTGRFLKKSRGGETCKRKQNKG